MALTFAELHARWPDCHPSLLAVAFDSLSRREQQECWARLSHARGLWIDAEMVLERDRYAEPPKRHQPSQRSTAASPSRPSTVALSTGDPLKQIPPAVYVEALTGEPVPASGRMRCPLPDHDDRTPSFQVLSSHWRCFGCNRGGSVIDFAAAWYGLEPRGSGYREIRRRLLAELGLGAEA